MIAHDLFAETNPAFGAYLLLSFVRGFAEETDKGPELPIAYLALPIIVSGDLRATFDGTNRRTGLQEWLERSPQIQVGLGERLNHSMDFVAGAVRLGCFSMVVHLSHEARLGEGTRYCRRDLATGLSNELAQSVRHAERLGYWCAAAGSTKTIYDTMGLTL
ncbi:three component ABC system middle component [Sphingomonas sanguinis]|uniref:three component ABC system middle component n=2 Tax=Sphingomonas sanguinis TaxID=33051 RepID=UPI003015A91D